MKTNKILFLHLLLCVFPFTLWGQQYSPASTRSEKITANWTDRAQLTGKATKPQGRNILWYRQSAKVWEEALPIGNGRLGAMIFGGVADERIQFNESTLWDGFSRDANNPLSEKALPIITSVRTIS